MRFKVVEVRAYQAEYLVEAESEDAAKRLAGTILDERAGDCYGLEFLSVEQVDDETEEL